MLWSKHHGETSYQLSKHFPYLIPFKTSVKHVVAYTKKYIALLFKQSSFRTCQRNVISTSIKFSPKQPHSQKEELFLSCQNPSLSLKTKCRGKLLSPFLCGPITSTNCSLKLFARVLMVAYPPSYIEFLVILFPCDLLANHTILSSSPKKLAYLNQVLCNVCWRKACLEYPFITLKKVLLVIYLKLKCASPKI